MYIACPKCDTNFMVLPEQIGPMGRKVKCSNCSHIWHQRLKESQLRVEPVFAIDNKFTPSGNGVNLPALLPIKIPAYLYTMPFVVIIMIILLCFILFQDKFGVPSIANQKELNISDVHIENIADIGKMIVSYKVVNNSDHETAMPLVRIRLFDKNKRVIKSHLADQTNVTLAPKQFLNIKTEFVSAPSATQEIDITLGNRLDFILR